MAIVSTRARRALFVILAGVLALVAGAALASNLDRHAIGRAVRHASSGVLWRVVSLCVADKNLTGLPFPCLAVDLSEGEDRGSAVLRPPWSNDLILTPTRRSVGIEDPFLQSPEAPNYFAAAWRSRDRIAPPNGIAPASDAIALVVNSRVVRTQDQLHIHIGCLATAARRFLDEAAPDLPLNAWRRIGPVVPHQPFWALRVKSAGLDGVEPFRLVWRELGRMVRDPADITMAVAGTRAEGEFVIFASYARAPGSWWPVGADDLMDNSCPAEAEAAK